MNKQFDSLKNTHIFKMISNRVYDMSAIKHTIAFLSIKQSLIMNYFFYTFHMYRNMKCTK